MREALVEAAAAMSIIFVLDLHKMNNMESTYITATPIATVTGVVLNYFFTRHHLPHHLCTYRKREEGRVEKGGNEEVKIEG